MVVPTKVEICAPIQFSTYYTNYGGPLRKADAIKKGNNYQLLATVLIDVCYRLYAQVVPNSVKHNLPDRALAWDNKTTSPGHAYQCIFNRRLEKGQCFSIPALGWKEFTPDYFGPFRENTTVCTDIPEIELPSMLRQVFSAGYNAPVSYRYDQNLRIKEGVLHFPKAGDQV